MNEQNAKNVLTRFVGFVIQATKDDSSELVDACKVAIGAVGKQIAEPVLVRRRDGYIRPDYYCPVCNKQQKDSFKNRREGCYCERCGQRLTF